MATFLFPGLRSDNLLAYLAALGVLRMASLAWPNGGPRLSWELADVCWQPRLHLSEDVDRSQFVRCLHKELQASSKIAAFNLADDLTLDTKSYRNVLIESQKRASIDNRSDVDFLSAFGSEVIPARRNGKTIDQMSDTAFRTMSGAGHQHFLGTIRTIVADTTAEHLSKALFNAWKYDDPLEKHSMRWDPQDDIRHALRWDNPSGDKNRKQSGSVWGANRLAIEALPLFPSQPVGQRLKTTGFAERSDRATDVTWAVWSAPIGLMEVLSLVSQSELQVEKPDRSKLKLRGIVDIYRCERFTRDKYRNFTPAWPV